MEWACVFRRCANTYRIGEPRDDFSRNWAGCFAATQSCVIDSILEYLRNISEYRPIPLAVRFLCGGRAVHSMPFSFNFFW